MVSEVEQSYHDYGGHVIEYQESHEEKSGLQASQKERLKSSEEEFNVMKIVAAQSWCGTGDLD